MVNKNLFFIFVLFLFLFGCLKDPSNDQYKLIEEKMATLKNQDCACFVCTESSGGILSDIFTYNDLSSGGCYIEEKCTTSFLATFFEDNDKNFLRPFDFGMGNTYVEYEEANLRTSQGQGILFKELKEYQLTKSGKYILPYYKGEVQEVKTSYLSKTFLDTAKNPIYRTLEKNTIPIYYINSEHLTTQWLDNFFKDTNIAPTTSFIAIKSSSINVQDLIKNINSKCDDKSNPTIIRGKCLKTENKCVEKPTGGQICQDVCLEYEERSLMVYGCKSMLYVDYVVNGSNIEYDEIINNLYQSGDEIKNVDSFLIQGNISKENGCHAGQITMDSANLSRTLMREYGTKPSYLILNIDEYCLKNFENEIAQSIFYNAYYMRMTGIMGVVYYDYISNSSSFNSQVELPLNFMKLANYYTNSSYLNSSTIKYNKEPLIFDNDGYNISKVCDIQSSQRMMTVNMSLVEKIKINRLDPSKLDTLNAEGETSWYYVYAIPMLDYGEWSEIETSSYNSEFDADCNLGGPAVHLDAEKCGVSNYLLMSYYKNNVKFNCNDWYNMIDSFVASNQLSVNSVQNIDTITMKKLAFAYAMKGEKKLLTYSEMKNYCSGSGSSSGVKDTIPCNVINDYIDIRAAFLDFWFYPDCYIPDIGVIN